VEDAGERYALPLTHVRETADLLPAQLRTIRGREVFVHRGEVLPLLRLDRVLGAPAANDVATEVAVIEAGGRAAAVAVDAFLGQHDLVVKRLPAVRGAFRIFGGATILEDGAPALILDAPALLHHSLS
jgi:two-component system chemotaxis sensor kinase CheA